MGYVVLHLDKSPDNEVPMTAHIARTKMPPNAMPELTYLNEELVEFPEGVADRTEAINHRLEHAGLTRKIGTNQAGNSCHADRHTRGYAAYRSRGTPESVVYR